MRTCFPVVAHRNIRRHVALASFTVLHAAVRAPASDRHAERALAVCVCSVMDASEIWVVECVEGTCGRLDAGCDESNVR